MTSRKNSGSLSGPELEKREAEIDAVAAQLAGLAPLTSERAKQVDAAMQAALDDEPRDPDNPDDVY